MVVRRCQLGAEERREEARMTRGRIILAFDQVSSHRHEEPRPWRGIERHEFGEQVGVVVGLVRDGPMLLAARAEASRTKLRIRRRGIVTSLMPVDSRASTRRTR